MLLLSALLVAANSKTVYVSPQGSDSNQGTQSRPVKTIQRALAIERSFGSGPKKVLLGSGDYEVLQTIDLDHRDNGLTFSGGAKVRLFGGPQLTLWRHVNDPAITLRLPAIARSHVLECDLGQDFTVGALAIRGFGSPEQIASTELFVDGAPAPLARYPAEGSWLRTGKLSNSNTFELSDTAPKTWTDWSQIWTFGYWNYDWADSYLPVSYDQKSSQLTLGGKPPFGIAEGRRFYFFNVLEELNQPGQWCLDAVGKKIYFWPPNRITGTSPIASELAGPMIHVDHAANVSVEHLDLEDGRDGGISVTNSEKVVISSCRIANFGTYGASIQGGSECGVTHCAITETGEDGVKLVAGDFKTQKPGRLFASDNHIWNYSRWCRTYHPGILVSGYANLATHNWIENAPHQAILLSGNDNIISYNDIRRVCTETGDAGAIYMGRDTTMRGNVIEYNRFRKIGPTVTSAGNYTAVMAVYLDDCWAGTTIQGNVFEGPGTGIMIGGGRDNKVINNVFVGTNPAIHFDARGLSWAAQYFKKRSGWNFLESFEAAHVTEPPYSTHYPALAATKESDLAKPEGNEVIDNICVGPWIQYLDGLTQKDLKYRDNETLASGSLEEALAKTPPGFKAIPFRQIGPRSH